MLRNKKNAIIIFLVVIIILLIIGIFFNYKKMPVNDIVLESDFTRNKEEISNQEKQIYVDVKGEVKKPGVYQVNETSIINDVIKIAGGLTKNAYTKNINLSKKVSNEMVIYIFSKKEILSKTATTTTTFNASLTKEELPSTTSVLKDNGVTTTVINYDNCITTSKTINEQVETQLKDNELVNINSASKEMLMNIPGIGESKADAIIIYRQDNTFKNIDDIKNVSGIGESLFAKIKDHITV